MNLKSLQLILILFFGIASSQSKTELLEITRIDNYSEKTYSDNNVKKYMFDVKGKVKPSDILMKKKEI